MPLIIASCQARLHVWRALQVMFERPFIPASVRFEHAAKSDGRFEPLASEEPLQDITKVCGCHQRAHNVGPANQ